MRPSVVEGDLGAGQRLSVVDAAAGGLAHPVGREHPDAVALGPAAQPGRQGGAADEHAVEGAQRLGPARVVEQAQQLGGHDARVAAAPGVEPLRGAEERLGQEAVGQVHGDRGGAGVERAQQHLQARDVVRRQREQPLPVAAEPLVRGPAAGQQGAGGEQGALRGAGRARRAHDHGQPLGKAGGVVRGQGRRGRRRGMGEHRCVTAHRLGEAGQDVQGCRAERDGERLGRVRGRRGAGAVGISGCGRASRAGPGRRGPAPAAPRGARWGGRARGRRPSTRRRSPRTSPRPARSSG